VSDIQSLIQPYTDAFVQKMNTLVGDGVQVTDGPPPAALLQTAAVVWVGDVVGVQTTSGLGNSDDSGPKQEQFEMQVHISILGQTTPMAINTHQLQGTQAFALFKTIGAALRANQSMGLTSAADSTAYVTFAEVRSPIEVKKGGNDQARETTLSFVVYVTGWLERAS
jgi:hypothetical protein